MLIPQNFLGSSYTSRSHVLATQEAINIYAELVETKDGKEVGGFYGTPGLLPQGEVGTGPWRALHSLKAGLFGVSGNKFYQITSTFEGVFLGTLQTDSGPVGMVDNGLQVFLVDGVNAYGYDIGANRYRTVVLPFDYGTPVVCAYQDGFFLMNQSGTQNWWQSNLNDCFTWDALNFSVKDGQPDPIISMLDNHREVWLFGSQTTEVWINQGSAGFAFGRLQGVFIQEGCAAPYSAAIAGTSVIWLSKSKEGQGVVLQARGYQAVRISTHAIERAIQSYSRIDDALAYTYEQEGHLFYMLTFPSADVTWCYDNNTGLWHRRAGFVNGAFVRHRSNCYALFDGKNIVGNFAGPELYAFDLDVYEDDGEPIKRLRSWQAFPTGQINLRKWRLNRLQIYCQPGVGTDSPFPVRVLDKDYPDDDPGRRVRILSGIENDNFRDPQLMLRVSPDGGLSWTPERWESLGKIGETQWRVMFRRLGAARDPCFEVSQTDAVKVAWLGAFLEADVGIS